MYMYIAIPDKCTGCMACVDACKKDAITIKNIGGLLYPLINREKCVNCNTCKNVCPALKTPHRATLSETKVYAVYSKDDEIRKQAASGGFCTQLGLEMIERGGYVATVIMRNNKTEYIITNNKQELLLGCNSKYVQGNPIGIYRKVKDLLNTQKEVLFCGLPCYCAAIKNFLKKDFQNLTTIELICSAAPSTTAIEQTLNLHKATEFIAFRKKSQFMPWGNDYNIVIKDTNGLHTKKREETIFYNIFASLMTARKSCTNCKFARLDRIADFTTGDFHNYRCPSYELGVNLVIANNAKANNIIKTAKKLQVIPETWQKAVNSNHRLYNGYDFLRFHPGVIFRKYIYKSKLFYHLCINKNPYRLIWLPFKVLTKIMIKIKYKEAIKTAYNLDNK